MLANVVVTKLNDWNNERVKESAGKYPFIVILRCPLGFLSEPLPFAPDIYQGELDSFMAVVVFRWVRGEI